MRYEDSQIIRNGHPRYKNFFEKRKLKFINHYKARKLRYPTYEELGIITTTSHIWKVGSKYYKLANKFYGDPELWWVIGWYNKAPTEAHLRVGDIIEIPTSLEQILDYYGYQEEIDGITIRYRFLAK